MKSSKIPEGFNWVYRPRALPSQRVELILKIANISHIPVLFAKVPDAKSEMMSNSGLEKLEVDPDLFR